MSRNTPEEIARQQDNEDDLSIDDDDEDFRPGPVRSSRKRELPAELAEDTDSGESSGEEYDDDDKLLDVSDDEYESGESSGDEDDDKMLDVSDDDEYKSGESSGYEDEEDKLIIDSDDSNILDLTKEDDQEDILLDLTDEEDVQPSPGPLTGQEGWLVVYDEKSRRDNEPPPTEPMDCEDVFNDLQVVLYTGYDALNVSQQEFYKNVQRTVTKLAELVESMPTQDNYPYVDPTHGLVPLYPHQRYGLEWLIWREREFPGGGILADEMGLGKTIIMIALIMRTKEARAEEENSWFTITEGEEEKIVRSAKTTLVVCPLSCIRQWEQEIATKGSGLSVAVYYKEGRLDSAVELAQKDVVLTTYDTIISEIPKLDVKRDRRRRKKKDSSLLMLYWRRVILDEAHNIRNPKTRKAQAVCRLLARHRWAVTGTPIHNRPEDMYSFVKFLRLTPFDQRHEWDSLIGLKKVRGVAAKNRLHTIGKALILRRTKSEVALIEGGVDAIPPKEVEDIHVVLSEEERQLYDQLKSYSQEILRNFIADKRKGDGESRSRKARNAYKAGGRRERKKPKLDEEVNAASATPTSGVNFSHIFALLTRLRQCSVLPHLIENMLEDDEEDDDEEKVKHDADDSVFDKFKEEHIVSKKNPIFQRLFLSSKFKQILQDVELFRERAQFESRRMDKIVIVSCWTSSLDILNYHLKQRGFSTDFITGRENIDERMDAQNAFNENPMEPQILLLSLGAGGVGLNLMGGNYVFFVEPHWNPQLELQAQDRVHRYGQKKNVTIRRYIADETIEERVLELQKIKIELSDGLLQNTKKRAGGGLTINQMKLLFQV